MKPIVDFFNARLCLQEAALTDDKGEVIGWPMTFYDQFDVVSSKSPNFWPAPLADEAATKLNALYGQGEGNGRAYHPKPEDEAKGNWPILLRVFKPQKAEVVGADDEGATGVFLRVSGLLLNTAAGRDMKVQAQSGMKMPISRSFYADRVTGEIRGSKREIIQGGDKFKPNCHDFVGEGGFSESQARLAIQEAATLSDTTPSAPPEDGAADASATPDIDASVSRDEEQADEQPITERETAMSDFEKKILELQDRFSAQIQERDKTIAKLTTDIGTLNQKLTEKNALLEEAQKVAKAHEAKKQRVQDIAAVQTTISAVTEKAEFTKAITGAFTDEYGENPAEAILDEVGGNVEAAQKVAERIARLADRKVGEKIAGGSPPIKEIQDGIPIEDNPDEQAATSEGALPGFAAGTAAHVRNRSADTD